MKATLIMSSIVMFLSTQALAADAKMVSLQSLETKSDNYTYTFGANKSVDAFIVRSKGTNFIGGTFERENYSKKEADEKVRRLHDIYDNIVIEIVPQREKISKPVTEIDKNQVKCIQSQVDVLNNYIKNSNGKVKEIMSYSKLTKINFFLDTSPTGQKEISPSIPDTTLSIRLRYNDITGCDIINPKQLEIKFDVLHAPILEEIATKKAVADLQNTLSSLKLTLDPKVVNTNTQVNGSISRKPAVVETDEKVIEKSNTTR